MSPPKDAYQIGWICALPIEVAAAKQMLDENFGMPDEQDGSDTNSYTLGRIGKHYIVIAGLPGGQYGVAAATAVAMNMMRTFSQSLRIGLMVGIGGGIPSADNDIRLGDIVVSQPQGTCGGVLQYDLGKEIGEDEFVRVGSLNSPPQALLTAAGSMRAAALTDNPNYPIFIEKATQRNARTRETFRRPAKASDRLFHFEHAHPTAADTCEICPVEWDVSRESRIDDELQVHYGIIASGNRVMKYGPSRERLRRETGALCFEMEAAGLMMNFPCIVVRGICDYADSHKNDEWQGYAALAAASYTKELLSYVPTARVAQEHLVQEICSEILEGVKSANKGIERAIEQQESHHKENTQRSLTKEQQECHQVFKTSTYEQFKDINPTRAVGTCRWILENPQYLDWVKRDHNDLLWISADPGCGKSVLARSLIDVELEAPGTIILYFFFKDNDEQNSLATALCAIIHQLFATRPGLIRHALPSWQKNGAKIQQEVSELWRIIEAAMSDPGFYNTICIFDALDECYPSDQYKLIHNLNAFYARNRSSHGQAWLKFLVTSRPYGEIMEGFRPTTQSFPKIHIPGEKENDQIREEISLVIQSRISELGKSLPLPSETQQRLETQLLQMEHRTYLWLHLAMDDIRIMLRNSLRPEQESIRLIPRSVEEAYRKILDRVLSDRASDVKMILCIIVGARRPLTIKEMAMALGVATSPTATTAAGASLSSVGLGQTIRELCGLFVFINNSRIYLIHQTAREYLTNSDTAIERAWSFKRCEIEDCMSAICINYLLLDDVCGNLPQKNEASIGLLDYSSEHWPDHVRGMSYNAESKAEAQLHRLYDVAGLVFAVWFPIFWYTTSNYISKRIISASQLAAYNGHERVLQTLLCEKSDVDQPKRQDRSGRVILGI